MVDGIESTAARRPGSGRCPVSGQSTGVARSLANDEPRVASVQVSSFNLHYTESGLFGVHIMCHKGDTSKVVKAVWNEFNKVLKNGITKEEFTVAK
jgi:hypothetical protein